MTLAGGRFKVYAAFGDAPFDASPTWTEITTYVRHLSCTRGRSSELDQFQAGTATLTLSNADRRFDPEDASSPYVGDIKPGVPVKVEFDDSGLSLTDEPVWYGYAMSWSQQSDPSNRDATCVLQCADGFTFLSRHQRADIWTDGVLAETGWDAFPLDDVAGTAMRVVLANGDVESGVWTSNVADAATIVSIGSITAAAVQASPAMYGFWNKDLTLGQYVAIIDVTESEVADGDFLPIVTYSYGPSSLSVMFMLEIIDAQDQTARLVYGVTDSDGTPAISARSDAFDVSRPRHVGFGYQTAMALNLTFGLDGKIFNTTGGVFGNVGTSVRMPGGTYFGWYKWPNAGTIKISRVIRGTTTDSTAEAEAWFADTYAVSVNTLDGDTTGERVGGVLDGIAWPAALRDIDTGQTTLGPQGIIDEPPINVLRRIEASEAGWLFIGKDGSVTFRDRSWTQVGATGATSQATFSDDGSNTAYLAAQFTARWDNTQVRNQSTVNSPTAGSYTHIDSTSVTAYGPASESVETVLKTAVELENLANYRTYLYGEPFSRFEPFSVRPESLPSAYYGAIIPLELADRVTVERTPQGVGSQIQIAGLLQSISWNITPGDAVVTFQVSPAGINDFAVWDTGEWDNDPWGY